jgi:pre-mRNA-processing factor 19
MKERDESREALTSLQKTMGYAPTSSGAQEAQEESADVEMEAQGALPADVEAKIMETNQACVIF